MFCEIVNYELIMNKMDDSFMSPLLKLDIFVIAHHRFIFIYVLLLIISY